MKDANWREKMEEEKPPTRNTMLGCFCLVGAMRVSCSRRVSRFTVYRWHILILPLPPSLVTGRSVR